MAKITTDNGHYSDIADAIRAKSASRATFRPDQMAAAIGAMPSGLTVNADVDVYPAGDHWVRPAGYPDLDSISIPEGFDGLYMTYDLSRTPGWGFIGVYVNTALAGNFTLERGHLENGVFVSDYSVTKTRGSYYRENLNEANGTIQLWRISSDKHITRFGFIASGTSTAALRYNYTQPCVERRGRLPWVTSCSSYLTVRANATDLTFGTVWLERDHVEIGANSVVTALDGMYGLCYRLVDVYTGWDTSNWAVTTLGSMFYYCMSLRHVDFSTWDTRNWTVITLTNMFICCVALQELDLSSWDTSHWRVAGLEGSFNRCEGLKRLDLSTWDTSNWEVKTMKGLFAGCRSLTEIDFTGWDTSGWAVTTLASVFESCVSLPRLDLSGWNTANWRVTTMVNMFIYNYSLKYLDFTGWDTSGWAVTTIAGMFSNCTSMPELDLSEWNTSGWRVTTMASMCANCFLLRAIDLSGWDTSGWAVTTFAAMFDYCRSLETLDISSWDTSNWRVTTLATAFRCCHNLLEITGIGDLDTRGWAVTTLANSFNSCYSLQHLDLSGWDTSGWAVTSLESVFTWCMSLQSIDIGDWDTSGWKVTTMATMFNECRSLKEIDLFDWDTSQFALTTCASMIAGCQILETFYMPDNFTTDTFKVTNANYQVTYAASQTLKNYNGYPVSINVNYVNYYCLSVESLVSIINKLPTVTAARTLTLGVAHRNKLTAEQIAVATAKGWTVA